MKPSNEFCVKFLEASGWLDNHDKQIRKDTIDEFRMALHSKYADNKYLYESNPEYWNLDMEDVDEISNQLKGAENVRNI